MSAKRIVVITILVMLLAGAGLHGLWKSGYNAGHNAGSAAGRQAVSDIKAEWDTEKRQQADAQIAALQAWQVRYQQQVNAAREAEADYLTTIAAISDENRKLQRKIDDVTTKWIDEKGKVHPVNCVFTRGFVQQYNAALGVPTAASATVAPGTGGAPTAPETPDNELRASGVTQRDILSNIADNGGQCRALKAQVNGLLDYIGGLSR